MPPDDAERADERDRRLEDRVRRRRDAPRASATRCTPLGVGDDLGVIRTRASTSWKPHIVFNLLEDFHGVPIYDQNVVSYLELLRRPLHRLQPARPDAGARQGAVEEAPRLPPHPGAGVRASSRIGRAVRRPKRLTFPLIVKSLTKEALGRHLAGLGRRRRREARRARRVHPRAASAPTRSSSATSTAASSTSA